MPHVVDLIQDMLIYEVCCLKHKNARWFLDKESETLFIYGTDDLRDWRDNLDGRTNELMPGLKITDGFVDHADLIAHSVRRPPERIVAHSLGAAAGAVLALRWGVPALLLGSPRTVIASQYQINYQGPQIWDVTHPMDPVVESPLHNERLPWWIAERIRLDPPSWWNVLEVVLTRVWRRDPLGLFTHYHRLDQYLLGLTELERDLEL